MASSIHGEEITDPKDPRRQSGKVAELQLGFGSGWVKFQASARARGVILSDQLAQRAVDIYRSTHPAVVNLWAEAGDALRALLNRETFAWRILEGRDGCLYHPTGVWLDYTRLKWEEGEYRLYDGRGWRRIYGSALVENVIQWLSRIITAEAMLRFDAAGYPIVGMSHDDVWLLVPKDDHGARIIDERDGTAYHKMRIIGMMSETPSWAPGLPLAADCKMGETYS